MPEPSTLRAPSPVNVAPVKSSVDPEGMRSTVSPAVRLNVPEKAFATVPDETTVTPPETVVVSSAVSVAPLARTIVSATWTGEIKGYDPMPYVPAPPRSELPDTGTNDLSTPNLMPQPPSIVTFRA